MQCLSTVPAIASGRCPCRLCPVDLLARWAEWLHRARSRRELEGLDERLRKDIGVSADEAFRESRKRFWIP